MSAWKDFDEDAPDNRSLVGTLKETLRVLEYSLKLSRWSASDLVYLQNCVKDYQDETKMLQQRLDNNQRASILPGPDLEAHTKLQRNANMLNKPTMLELQAIALQLQSRIDLALQVHQMYVRFLCKIS